MLVQLHRGSPKNGERQLRLVAGSQLAQDGVGSCGIGVAQRIEVAEFGAETVESQVVLGHRLQPYREARAAGQRS